MISNPTTETRTNDEKFFKNFMKKQESNNVTEIRKNITKIPDLKAAVSELSHMNKQLITLANELQSNNLSNEMWYEKIKFCEVLKQQMKVHLEIMKTINKPLLKKRIEKRKHLRKRQKEKKKERLLTKKYLHERRCRLEKKIDNWIKEKQNEINREKEEENLRKDADIVLSDVRAKRLDSKKFLILLRELEHLRKVKATNSRAKGEVVTAESDEVFSNIIVNLKQQWSTLDREYLIEEKGLKLMIQADNEKKISKQARNIFDDWERVFFNNKIKTNQNSESDHENLIIIRAMWDKFLNVVKGSEIPVGWVMPYEASSTAWTRFLRENIIYKKK